MHGIIFQELKKYVVTKLGDGAWDSLLVESGLGFKSYLASSQYPDQEVVVLVQTASKVTKQPVSAILEDFGAFIVPDLATVYGALIQREWKALDLLEHARRLRRRQLLSVQRRETRDDALRHRTHLSRRRVGDLDLAS